MWFLHLVKYSVVNGICCNSKTVICAWILSVLECTIKTMADQFSICSLCYLVWKKSTASLCSVFRSSAVLIRCKIPHLKEIRLFKEKCIFLEYLCICFYLWCHVNFSGLRFFFFSFWQLHWYFVINKCYLCIFSILCHCETL